MPVVLLVVLIILAFFVLVVFFGAPYVPTLKNQQKEALELLDLKPGQTLLELGSGDGRLLKMAAQRGIKAVGYELNPILYLISVITTFKYRKNIKVIMANYWLAKWPRTDAIYIFSASYYMKKLNTKIMQENIHNTKIVSYAMPIPDKKITKKVRAMYLYKY